MATVPESSGDFFEGHILNTLQAGDGPCNPAGGNGHAAIRDQYPKYVVTMDDFWKDSVEGVRHFHISDFLLDSGY